MKAFNFIGNIFQRFPLLLISSILLLILFNLFAACTLFALGPITDFLMQPDLKEISPFTVKIIHGLEFFHLPVKLQSCLFIFLGLIFLSSALQIIAYYFVAVIRYKIMRNILMETFEDFFNARWLFFSSEKQGVLINTFTREFSVFGMSFRVIADFFSTIVLIAVSLSIPFYISAKTTLVSLGVVAVFSIPFIFIGKYSYKLGQLNTSTSNNFICSIYENLGFAKLLLGFGNQDKGLVNLDNTFNAFSKASIKTQTLNMTILLFYRPIAGIAVVTALFSALYFNVPLSETIILIAALFQSALSIGQLTAKQNNLEITLPSYEQIEGLRLKARGMKQISGMKKFTGFDRAIILNDLYFAYPKHSPVLSKINIIIPKGKMIAFVGKSGAGKSTLIDLIMGFHAPASGHIKLDEIPLKDYDIHSYRRKLGYVPQESVLFNMSIRDNLLWANPAASENQIKHVCRMAYADEFIEKLPEGYNTLVGDRGVRLSGGQIQRVALARAFLRKPELLILDEATSALDTHSECFIQKAIENFSKETTIIVVAHRLSTIKKADCIYILDDGKVVEQGTYKKLIGETGIFNSMAHLQKLEFVQQK